MADPTIVQRGVPVEFTHNGKVGFGICAKTGKLGEEIEIETTHGIVKTWHILAYAWAGWMPEEIIKIWEKHNPTSVDDMAEFE
jgi:hypothetical protein